MQNAALISRCGTGPARVPKWRRAERQKPTMRGAVALWLCGASSASRPLTLLDRYGNLGVQAPKDLFLQPDRHVGVGTNEPAELLDVAHVEGPLVVVPPHGGAHVSPEWGPVGRGRGCLVRRMSSCQPSSPCHAWKACHTAAKGKFACAMNRKAMLRTDGA